VTRIALPALSAAFVGLGLVLPNLRHRRRTGEWAIRVGSGAEWILGTLLLASFGGAVAFAIAYGALGPDALGVRPAPAWLGALGLALMVFGIAVVVAAQAQMGLSWRIGIDERKTALVRHGLYALVRNPIYTGMLAALAGEALAAPSAALALAWTGSAIAIAWQTRREERHLLRLHGEEFAAWAARVGRFVPGIGRLRPPEPR
jgi:protein-S-isoprenylcysteine O-methyltransferase Ste14